MNSLDFVECVLGKSKVSDFVDHCKNRGVRKLGSFDVSNCDIEFKI